MSVGTTTHQGARAPEDFCAALRDLPLVLPENGETGFEGLSAALATAVSGIPLRISGAGDQAGGDAAGPDGTSRLMLEAKRYGGRAPRTADLRQKLVQSQTRRDVDLWVLDTTATLCKQALWDLVQTGQERKSIRRRSIAAAVSQGDWIPDGDDAADLVGAETDHRRVA